MAKSTSCFFKTVLSPDRFQKIMASSFPTRVVNGEYPPIYICRGTLLNLFFIDYNDEYFQIVVPAKDGYILSRLAQMLSLEEFMGTIETLASTYNITTPPIEGLTFG